MLQFRTEAVAIDRAALRDDLSRGREGVVVPFPFPSPKTEADAEQCGVATSVLKRAFDILASGALIVFLAPLLAVITLLVKLDSSGSALFRQRRSGLDGRIFTILKFRTMTVTEDDHVRQATRGDKRVTRIGSFLRKSSLDELPQLFNVLRGDMSLVGPRPHALSHDAEFERVDTRYTLRFRTRPGVTGLAQATGLRGEITSNDAIVDRVRADNFYIDNWSLFMDVKILARTAVLVLFGDKAAY